MPRAHRDVDVEDGAALARNMVVYEALIAALDAVVRRGSPAAVLQLAEKIAEFAVEGHVGCFADGRLENPVHAAGTSLPVASTGAGGRRLRRANGRRRVLHVLTDMPAIGGHARTVANWIAADPSSIHSLVIIGSRPVPRPFVALALQRRGTVTLLRGTTIEKARQLRALARAAADLVILNVKNSDPVACLAFANNDLPPVGLVNHGDHLFWMGNSVADTIINQRSMSLLVAPRRVRRPHLLLPIPLANPTERRTRASVRASLGIPESQVVLASVGRAAKYRPDATHDFFRAASTLLDRYPAAHLYVVGLTTAEASGYSHYAEHPRLHAIGPVEDPTDVLVAADVYIESFPFGSQTACLEACMHGVPPVLALAPACPVIATSDDAIDDLVCNPTSEEEHLERVGDLIDNASRRRALGAEVRRRVIEMHTGEGWLSHLDSCYVTLAGVSHQHGEIPARVPASDPLDRALSAWHEAQRTYPLPADPRRLLSDLVNEFAYILRTAGCYREAILLLESCRRASGSSMRTTGAIAKTATRWAFSRFRKAA